MHQTKGSSKQLPFEQAWDILQANPFIFIQDDFETFLNHFNSFYILDEKLELIFDTNNNRMRLKEGNKISNFKSITYFKKRIEKITDEYKEYFHYNLAPPIMKLNHFVKNKGVDDEIYLFLTEDLSRFIFNQSKCCLHNYMENIRDLKVHDETFFVRDSLKISTSDLKKQTDFHLKQ